MTFPHAVKVLNKKGNTFADLEQELEEIPPKFYDLYDTFLEAIDQHHVKETNMLLSIALAGQGFLDVEDFLFAMALGSKKIFSSQRELQRQFDFVQDDLTIASRIQDRCGNLLEVKMRGSDDNILRGFVDFYHCPVKDYLSQSPRTKGNQNPTSY